jgi:hypothetical protein
MQGILTHIPETNHVLREYIVAAILSLFMVHWLFCSFMLALPALCVQCPIWLFCCSSLMSWFPGMSLMYFQNDFEMVPVTPIITGITLVFTFHMHCISIVRSLYFKIFSASFTIIIIIIMFYILHSVHYNQLLQFKPINAHSFIKVTSKSRFQRDIKAISPSTV